MTGSCRDPWIGRALLTRFLPPERLLLVRSDGPCHGRPISSRRATRVSRAATRTPSRMQRTTLHLGEIQGAFHRGVPAAPKSLQAATTPTVLPPSASLPTRLHALRCALGKALSRPTTCRSSVSVNRTTPSTPRASATSTRSHWPAAPRPSDESRVLSAPAPASRFIPFEGS